MSLESIIIFLAIGALAGWLAGMFMKNRGLGIIGNIILGIVGGFVGGWLFGKLGVPMIVNGIVTNIIASFAGAVVILFIIGLIKRR